MPQISEQKSIIEGDEYVVRMLDPMEANDLLIDIGTAVGPVLSSLVGAANAGKITLDDDIDTTKLGDGVMQFFSGLDKAVVHRAINSLANVTEVVGKGKLSQIKAVHFRGRLGLMYKWLGFALRVQYADFLDSLGTVITLAGQAGDKD